MGAVVLAGGQSKRMGAAKAALPFGPETLLARIVRIVGEVTSQVVVVAAQDQELPPLPATTIIARDRRSGRGPLEGFAVGLSILNGADVVYLTGCDTPLVTAAFVRRVIDMLGPCDDAAVPVVDGQPQPLAAAYRPTILSHVEQALSENRLCAIDLLDRIHTNRIDAAELRTVDLDLLSLRNLNTPADYRAALAAAGLLSEN